MIEPKPKPKIAKKYTIIGCLLLLTVVLLPMYIQKESLYKEIHKDPGYAVGVISKYYTSRQSVSFMEINFFVDNKFITADQSYDIPSYEEYLKKKTYLVVYNKNDPETCLLLKDYPIIDSTDYFRYIEKFKEKPFNFK